MPRIRGRGREILIDARQRVATAENDVSECHRRLEVAQAVLQACRIGYDALEKSLTLQPRQSSSSKPATKFASKSTKKAGKKRAELPANQLKIVCAFIYADGNACNQNEDNPIHEPDGGYAGYHPFTTSVPADSVAHEASAGD